MDIYLILTILLLLFAVFDIIMGVGNDAVNFLGSAIGSKAAPFAVILIIASVGVTLGAMSAGGMMEIARSGIFVPDMFTFRNVMWIFMGVMLSDVMLFNTFNTLGLPTSTSVSIVFELLGGSVAMAFANLSATEGSFSEVLSYINTSKVLTIIAGIFLSIFVAFIFGFIVQWITRLLFTFNYKSQMLRFGSIFGGVATTIISYFILIKGLKQSDIFTAERIQYVHEHTGMVLLVCFGFWTIVIHILRLIFKINVLKFIVLAGTFALALAFAGNDLVNFIGVPLAGLSSYKIYLSHGGIDDSINMAELATSGTDKYILVFLFITGLIMTFALWLARKAAVTKTTLNLSSQSSDSEEQFGSSMFARLVVRSVVNFSENVSRYIPQKVSNFIERRFEPPVVNNAKDTAQFDLLRASINLIVASMLIAFGTSAKLPLSTTYVTFIVTMATSLADGAWGRDSAVYRITGVVTVIAGWFLTAFVAFSVAAICVTLLNWGEEFALIPLLALELFVLVRTRIFRSKKADAQKQKEIDLQKAANQPLDARSLVSINSTLSDASKIINSMVNAFSDYDRQELKHVREMAKTLDISAKQMKDTVQLTIKKVGEDSLNAGLNYVQMADYIREIARSVMLILQPVCDHVNNNHKPLHEDQKNELLELSELFSTYIGELLSIVNSGDYADLTKLVTDQTEIFNQIDIFRKRQIKRAKAGDVNTRNSLLYLQILHETKQIVSYSMNVLKSYRDLVNTLSK